MATRSRIGAACAALALAGGVAIAANAATAACGGSCVSLYNQQLGTGQVLTYDQTAAAIVLSPASNSKPTEDFIGIHEGSVQGLADAGVLSKELTVHYASDDVWEYQYAPNGVPSGNCVGAGTGRGGLTPQKCGTTKNILWITDTYDAPSQNGSTPLISGINTGFADPSVLTLGRSAVGVYGLSLSTLTISAGVVSDTQMFAGVDGVLP